MAHEADPWIASNWMGKEVRQERGSADCVGRVGEVEETMFDEKGALHCRMVHNSAHGMTNEWWCPAALLEIVQCQWCNTPGPVTAMPDDYKVCDTCKPDVEKYYHCPYCNVALKPMIAERARKKFERQHCHSTACKRADDIKYGRLCCKKAEVIPCVCAYSYKCPEHAPNGCHVGTHD